ncbi:protein of unknown function [Streptococcus thermophilus]|uniref:Uncharacterized protein n=1 Tax=Streptococcus thermophilus TaxID=1308 RepID=A0A8D6U342_STRTR|nr:protein of unknown function [Streptococcus thermophilus]
MKTVLILMPILFFYIYIVKLVNHIKKTEHFTKIFGFLTLNSYYARIMDMLENLTNKSIIGGCYGTYRI